MCRIASLELGNNVPRNLKIFSLGCIYITIERYLVGSFSLVTIASWLCCLLGVDKIQREVSRAR